MTALIQRLRKEEKGLTLIELLAVIVIIGVIAAIAIPLIGGLISDTKENARVATANQILEAAKLYSIANNNGEIKGTPKLSDLISGGYLQGDITDPQEGKPLDTTNTVVYLDVFNSNGTDAVVTLAFSSTTGDSKDYKLSDLKTKKSTPSEDKEEGK